MKLIIKEYLSSLRERGELDVLLPDLLSQIGLRVFSRPGRGTRQYGVDIAAVGALQDGVEKVFLLSVKSGNLGRQDWDTGVQSLRPSLNEIIDFYIPAHLPPEYKELPIDICICIGGDIDESIRPNLSQYTEQNSTDVLKIVEWDGDRLAAWIEKYFLQENLLAEGTRPLLRKSLALLDEPPASFRYFADLLKKVSAAEDTTDAQKLIALRQMNVCLWILFSWAREVDNLESSFLAAERTLLYAWDIAKSYFSKQSKVANAIKSSFLSTLVTYQIIRRAFFFKILPYVGIKHGLSTAVHSNNKIDINLKLFEVLGRLALAGIWTQWQLDTARAFQEKTEDFEQEIDRLSQNLKLLIINNPTLFTPVKDDQAIDISLAVLFLSPLKGNDEDIVFWLSQILDKAIFSYQAHGIYPCIHCDYPALLEHPERADEEYRQDATAGSLLYPMIGLWAALLNNEDLYKKVQKAKEEHFPHCTFQFWYPDKDTENHWCKNDDLHGATFSQVPIEQNADSFLVALWDECEHVNAFSELSCVKMGLWPLFLVASRHYRLPVPLDFTLEYRKSKENQEIKTNQVDSPKDNIS